MKDKSPPIASLDDIPKFATEAQEQAFWDKHELDAELFDSKNNDALLNLPLGKTKSRNISIRLEEDVIKRAKVIAKEKGVGYQTLLKQFMIERAYEEEKRLGILTTNV